MLSSTLLCTRAYDCLISALYNTCHPTQWSRSDCIWCKYSCHHGHRSSRLPWDLRHCRANGAQHAVEIYAVVAQGLEVSLAASQEVVDDPGGNKMLLVMDYMEGGPVLTREGLERGRRIPEPLALQYFRDMCKVRTVLCISAL